MELRVTEPLEACRLKARFLLFVTGREKVEWNSGFQVYVGPPPSAWLRTSGTFISTFSSSPASRSSRSIYQLVRNIPSPWGRKAGQ